MLTPRLMGEEVELYDVIIRVAKNFGLILETDSDDEFSITKERLYQAIQNAALALSRAKCIEPSRTGFWKITTDGVNRLKGYDKKL